MPEAIVGGTLVVVRQHFVRFVDFLELRFGVVRLIHVRMILACEFAVGPFDVIRASALLDAQHFVIIALAGSHDNSHSIMKAIKQSRQIQFSTIADASREARRQAASLCCIVPPHDVPLRLLDSIS